MKRCLALLVCAALLLQLGACSGGRERLLPEGLAQQEVTVLLYRCDGQSTLCVYLEQAEQSQLLQTLDGMRARRAEDWSLEKRTFPIYGLEIRTIEGPQCYAAWTNGFWIDADGAVWDCALDLTGFCAQHDLWANAQQLSWPGGVPCIRYLCADAQGWDAALLKPAEEPQPPEEVTMRLDEWTQEQIKVTISNRGESEWIYNEAFWQLEVLLDGVWYRIPAMPGVWAYALVGHGLPAGEEIALVYCLDKYGSLPPGTYRCVVDNMLSVEHTIAE